MAMASSVSYLNGVRTRFLNTLTTEIKNETDILSCDGDKIDIEEFIGKVNKCIEKKEKYSNKLESQTEKLAEKISDNESEFIEQCIDENEKVINSSDACRSGLKHFKEW